MTIFLWVLLVLSAWAFLKCEFKASFSGYVTILVLILLIALSAGCLFGDLLEYLPIKK